ncbi:hypothetical protein FA15DRAFT_640830 [Coprinopsis marcescibilis]|uniref:Uncharacterized protein n=1 Tax=Coprinopsis marcescibilis TaxID=230819 RepID=A0A5C3KVV0_COPMA|nr:hypothetical protein FA15DRAFT_640830 [Coprinopsis marcescibilis]
MTSNLNDVESAMDVDSNGPDGPTESSKPRLRPLTQREEQRLIAYLDERMLQLTRNHMKRSEHSSTTQTLTAYLEEARRIMALILQIPAVYPSGTIRIAYLLRLTGDALGATPGYSLTRQFSGPLAEGAANIVVDPQRIKANLVDLLDFLDDLDQAWLAVLEGQAWDPTSSEGVDVFQLLGPLVHSLQDNQDASIPDPQTNKSDIPPKLSKPSQTDKTRLRSLLLGGEATLEEWIVNEKVDKVMGMGGTEDDITGLLDKLGLLDEFDNIFTRTMDHLGGFGDIKQSDLMGGETPMSDPSTSKMLK